MLTIRLSRTGKKVQPFFRIVVAEHSRPVQGKFKEVVGFYNPLTKQTEIKKERIEYWVSKGARPSDSAAALFKTNGLTGMEKFIAPRDKKRKKRNGEPEPAPQAAAPAAEAEENK